MSLLSFDSLYSLYEMSANYVEYQIRRYEDCQNLLVDRPIQLLISIDQT